MSGSNKSSKPKKGNPSSVNPTDSELKEAGLLSSSDSDQILVIDPTSGSTSKPKGKGPWVEKPQSESENDSETDSDFKSGSESNRSGHISPVVGEVGNLEVELVEEMAVVEEPVADPDPISVGTSSAAQAGIDMGNPVGERRVPKEAEHVSEVASVMNRDYVAYLLNKYSFPEGIYGYIPKPDDRADNPPIRKIPIYEDQLEAGLRLPLHRLFVQILQFWSISLGQLTPNAVRIVCGFIVLCKCLGVHPSLELLRYFYLLRSNGHSQGFFYFANRPKKPQLAERGPSSIKKWKRRFFFVKCRKAGVYTKWNYMDHPVNKKPSVNMREVTKLISSGFIAKRSSFTEEQLSIAGISSLSPPKAYKKGIFFTLASVKI